MKLLAQDNDPATKPLTGGKAKETIGNGRHILTITPVMEERESDVEDDRFVTVYTPTTAAIENGGTGKMAPTSTGHTKDVDLELGVKPKAYIFPLVQSGGAGSGTESAQSTPSDSRSMCDTPDNDPWLIPELKTATGPAWDELNTTGKIRHVALILGKVGSLLLLLYFFICSLDLLSSAFRLLGSRAVGRFFNDNELLQNPVVGLMIGVLVTVLVQSSSTSTSIVVTMVASKIIEVRQAIPIVMGANIGTSVTNTIVSLMQSADRNEFRRAFAAATVHDMFNWLTVLVLLPTEVFTRYLEILTTWIIKGEGTEIQQDKTANRDYLNKLTKPFTKMVIQIDKKLLEKLASGNESDPNVRLVIQCDETSQPGCANSIFGMLGFDDSTTGVILLIISIVVLCTCLIFLVKVLNSMLTGHIAKLIKRTMNRNYQFPYNIIADYLAIFVGCIMTILVQSSSIFTSALTPLAGIGVISLERIYPLTLGSNIGTTTTGILAALAADSSRIQDTLQLALCHLFFNISGILLFYPLPMMRWPIPLARLLGNITATYRWFSILYLISMFFLLPLMVFSLSTLGTLAMVCVSGPFAITLALVIIINLTQHYHSNWLPSWFQNWHFLPLWMRSLEPLDRIITKLTHKFGCASCCGTESTASSNQLAAGRTADSEKSGQLTDSNAASQLNILGALIRSNSESQFQNLIYNQGRIGMIFHGFGNHHTIHGVYNPHRHHVHTGGRTNRIKSMAPQYNRAYNTNNNNNNNNGDDDDSPDSPNYFNHHTVHNPYEVHRYYPASPFNSPFGSPTRANRTPLQVIVSQPTTPAEPAEPSEETKAVKPEEVAVVLPKAVKGEEEPNVQVVTPNTGQDTNGDDETPFETNL